MGFIDARDPAAVAPPRARTPTDDPKAYCLGRLAALRAHGPADRTLLAVLAHFALRSPSAAAFADELRRLAEDAGHRGQADLARAALRVLCDWDRRTAE